MDAFQVGDEVKVMFNLRGREWTSPSGEVKYFNSLDAWRIERVAAAPSPMASSAGSGDFPPLPPEEEDDLPF